MPAKSNSNKLKELDKISVIIIDDKIYKEKNVFTPIIPKQKLNYVYINIKRLLQLF